MPKVRKKQIDSKTIPTQDCTKKPHSKASHALPICAASPNRGNIVRLGQGSMLRQHMEPAQPTSLQCATSQWEGGVNLL